jgi:hypothetical protein
MRLPIFILPAVLLVVMGFGARGQSSDDIKLVNEFDPRTGCETLARAIDYLLVEASNDVQSIAYIVIHQGDSAFDNLVVYRYAANYPRFRGFPAERFSVLLTRGSKDIKVELWIGKNGIEPPVDSSELAIRFPESVSRIRLTEDTLELVTIDGQDTYIGAGNPTCVYWFNLHLLWELLKANEEFDAELLVKTTSKRRHQKLVAILKTKFREIGIPFERIRFVYGGQDKEIESSAAKLASVTTSFVKSVRQ